MSIPLRGPRLGLFAFVVPSTLFLIFAVAHVCSAQQSGWQKERHTHETDIRRDICDMLKIYVRIVAVFTIAVALLDVAHADPSSAAKALAATWTASDQPYRAVMDAIRSEHKRGVPTGVIALEYKMKAALNPKDPVTQFGYVIISMWQCEERPPEHNSVPYDLVTRLKSIDPGNVHLIAEYEFLITDDVGVVLPLAEIEKIGGALLIYDPHDRYAYRSLIYQLRDVVGGTDEGLRYAKQWVAWDGSNPDAHLLLGDLYQCKWLEGKYVSSYYKKMFHAEFNTALRTAPKGSSDADIAKRFLRAAQMQGG
jgi:hypothetical protein